MATTYRKILYEVMEKVATITINRPNQLNALTDLTQAEIRHALAQSERNKDIIGTVLTGAGRGFCSGVDMNALGEMSEAGKTLGNTYEHLNATPGNPDNDPNYNSSPTYFLGLRKPLIAAINGAAAGLGFSYATFCGMRFMDRNAKIVTSFAPRGLIAEHGTCWMLPKLVGPGKAMELVLTSKMINSAEELDIGLINKRVADDELQVTAAEMASLIAGFPPMSVHLNKVGLKLDADMDTQFRHENMALNVLKKTEDAKEAASAFREKCTPVFTPR